MVNYHFLNNINLLILVNLFQALTNKSAGQVSRIIKRLKVKGLIKKAGRSYRYFLTTLGNKIIATALNFKEIICRQQLSY